MWAKLLNQTLYVFSLHSSPPPTLSHNPSGKCHLSPGLRQRECLLYKDFRVISTMTFRESNIYYSTVGLHSNHLALAAHTMVTCMPEKSLSLEKVSHLIALTTDRELNVRGLRLAVSGFDHALSSLCHTLSSTENILISHIHASYFIYVVNLLPSQEVSNDSWPTMWYVLFWRLSGFF